MPIFLSENSLFSTTERASLFLSLYLPLFVSLFPSLCFSLSRCLSLSSNSLSLISPTIQPNLFPHLSPQKISSLHHWNSNDAALKEAQDKVNKIWDGLREKADKNKVSSKPIAPFRLTSLCFFFLLTVLIIFREIWSHHLLSDVVAATPAQRRPSNRAG